MVFGVEGEAPDPEDGEDLSEDEGVEDISLCHDPELLIWTLYSSPEIV